MAGERARFGGDAFLHAAIARKTDHVLIENAVLIGVETRRGHFRRHRDADRVADALTERPGRAFDSGRFEKFRMARRLGMQLPEAFDLRHRQIVAAHVQPRVKEHAAVSGREDEDIAIDPARLVRIVFQRVPKEDCAHFRAAKRQPKMPRLRGLHGIHAQTARLSRCFRKNFNVQTHACFISRDESEVK